MRRFVIASCVLSAGLAAPAQSPQQPVFRAGVELITLDVTVVDKDGKPIKGLKAEDFVVTLEGQARPVRALDFLEFGNSAGSESTAAPRETSNQGAPAGPVNRGGRVFLIVFDDLSAKPLQAKLLTVAAERMLARFDAGDLIGLVTTSGLGPVVQPTRDRAALMAALKSKTLIGRYDDNPAPRFYVGLHEAIDIFDGRQGVLARVIERECGITNYDPRKLGDYDMCPNLVEADGRHLGALTVHRTATQMAAYRVAIAAMGKAPSPRIIIAISSGVATSVQYELKEQTEAISRAAAEAGVQFYALTEAEPEFDMTHAESPERRMESMYLAGGVHTVATAAGGEAFNVVGQADRFYKRIEAETSGFYRLGVEAPVSQVPRRFLTTKVTVSRAGSTVRTNPQALASAVPPDSASIEDRLRAALVQGGTSFGVPIALATALRRDPSSSGVLQLGVNVQVPALVSAPLMTMFSVIDEAGKVVQQGRRSVEPSTPAADYELALPVPLPEGRYRLRFAVADAAGNIGSLERPVSASLAHLGHCAVSELLTSWEGADHSSRFLALETLPSRAVILRASLELYPDDPAVPLSLTVRLALLAVGEADPIVEREITPVVSGSTRVITASLPVDTLAPGTYVIRAVVLEGGTVTGQVTTSLRKSAVGGGRP